MPKISALGGMSSRGFGEFAQQTAGAYIEDVFSTYLYTGNGGAQTITNGIDLSTKGGMVWVKSRSAATNNQVWDSARGQSGGNYYRLCTNTNDYQFATLGGITSFNTNGFSLNGAYDWNTSSATYTSWTFRKQPKFFDCVTYTGDGSGTLQVSHNLGSQPGFIILKQTSLANDWQVFARDSATTYKWLQLNTTNSAGATPLQSNVASSTKINIGWIVSNLGGGLNASGQTYVAYLFAHDAGGFGADGSQNVISCGSFTTDASGNSTSNISLGWEPQFVILKRTDAAQFWWTLDSMRQMSLSDGAVLFPNQATAETLNGAGSPPVAPNATGFSSKGLAISATYIYMAIRRGPMKTPTDATKVFAPTTTATAASPGATATTGFPVDLSIYALRNLGGLNSIFFDRLRGSTSTSSRRIVSSSTAAEATSSTNGIGLQSNTTVTENWTGSTGYNNILWNFGRAPGFFDVVCYSSTLTGTQFANINHNLSAVPELIFVKGRSGTSSVDYWAVYSVSVGNTKALLLNDPTGPVTSSNYWNNTTPTSSVFTVGANPRTGADQTNYVAYLFASCPGVSKVGSYTGNGTINTISCGFTGGARYVLIKRTDSTGDWWVWDTARGMVAGTDPRLAYNSTAAETNANWVYTTTGGFQIVTSDATVNASGGTYIYLAIA